ncbi:MAG: thymidylate kinase [Eubacteriaceae bacterium]|nr:thymidylate kinase [Eubacteriaceae bacterium]
MSGKLFVIEGLDGSGKQTQTSLMYDALVSEGYRVMKVEYPNYKSESSALVKMYLRGDFGSRPGDVDPYVSSTFFAADRYASFKTEYEDFYRSGGIVLADRYTTSNMVHQASKITDPAEKIKYLDWLCDFEFRLYGIPRPEQVFFLDMEPENSAMLIKERLNKFSHEAAKDIHESDREYLEDSYANALWVVERYGWEHIRCTRNGVIKSIEEIHGILLERLKKYL